LEMPLSTALKLEVKYVSECFGTDEPKMRARAFKEKASKK